MLTAEYASMAVDRRAHGGPMLPWVLKFYILLFTF